MRHRSNGSVSWGTTGRRTVLWDVSRRTSRMDMSIWVTRWGWLLLHSLISVIWLWWVRLNSTWEALQQAPLVQEKLSQSRILPKPWPSNVSSSIAQTPWITSWSVNSSKDSHPLVPGAVSTSSIVSTSKCCLSSLNNCLFCSVKKPKEPQSSNSKAVPSSFSQHSVSSSPWTPVTQAEHNFQTTWKLFSEQWRWWCLITLWSVKSCFIHSVSQKVVH